MISRHDENFSGCEPSLKPLPVANDNRVSQNLFSFWRDSRSNPRNSSSSGADTTWLYGDQHCVSGGFLRHCFLDARRGVKAMSLQFELDDDGAEEDEEEEEEGLDGAQAGGAKDA
jgi:hypothetical protein